MKRNIFIKALSVILTVSLVLSCSQDSLDLNPINDTEASYFTEELHFKNAVFGAYAKLSDLYWYNANNPIHMFWLLPGDDLTTVGDIPFEVFGTLNSSNGEVSKYYQTLYQVVARANVALDKLNDPDISSVITTAGLKDNLKGEALFLRAYAYMQLWNYFGTAPLVAERIKTSDGITPPSSVGTELLDQAIVDFEMAAGFLPATYSASDKGRANKNAAFGLMGKALVIRASWTGSAVDYNSAITTFGSLTGLSLTPDFASNFDAAAENNIESLFEYQASSAGGENVWLSNDFNQAIGTFSSYWGFFDDHWSFWAHTPYVATEKLMDAFETGDPRADATFNSEDSRFKKFVDRNAYAETGVGSLNNPRILRYADVLLLWAEALNETGNQNGAIAKINEVRTRARDMDVSGIPANRADGASQASVRTWIQDERLIELAGEEGHRWIDLRRWHKAGHIDLATFNFSSLKDNLSIELPKNLNYPIPTSETDRNPNVLQNEGY